ncbi:protein TBATA isoform X2 [Hyaena hyaena]|uniref:protein TBATA isoform X2 n=1 Tax=Hyaena hyaena TaxID=95912 RepID=UPI0019240E57|nr:protein TBATA isoform X2 [Hyaena hyaena]
MATEVKTQLAEHPLMRVELKPEKKLKHRPRSHGNSRPQKELMIPGIVEFQLIQAALRTPKPPTPAAYRFGRLSHHSFFSRHHPHPQRVTHIQDLTGKPVCVVRDNFSLAPLPQATLLSCCLTGMPTISVPIGDPQSNRDPRLSYEAWKKELKNLASRVAVFTKESELKSKKKEEAQREQGAKYSAETGRLIPTSTQAIGRRHHSRQGPRIYPSGKDGGVETFTLQDQELLGGLILPGIRFSGPVGRGPRAGLQGLHLPPRAPAPADHSHSGPPSSSDTDLDLPLMTLDWRTQGKEGPEVILELLCQILQTDSLSAIQHWLLHAPPKEKDLALGLLQTAVAQLLPQSLDSIPVEKPLDQLQEGQEPSRERQQPPCSQSLKRTKTLPLPKGDKPEYIGKAQVLRMHSSQNATEEPSKPKAEC